MKVFLNYAAADKELAKRVADALKDAGFQVWDESEIFPGDNWAALIGEALEEANAMVVLFTPSSVHEPHVRRNVSYALGNLDYEGRVVPVLAAPKEQLWEEIPWILKKFPMVNLAEAGEKKGLRRIAQILQEAA